MKWDIARQR